MQPVINEQALIAAWTRVRALATSTAPVGVDELRELENTLRPVAGVAEIQQVLVPLLDRGGLPGLAMAWDGDPNPAEQAWLFARAERWLKLCAPEFAFLCLAQLNALGAPIAEPKQRASELLERERAQRNARYEHNLRALEVVDPDVAQRLEHYPRLSVALSPLGAGVAEYAGHGGPMIQLWAPTPAEAVLEAEQLVARAATRMQWYIAGVGDCTLPTLAAQGNRPGQPPNACVHVVEGHVARIRALLELSDLSAALTERRIRFHAGAHGVDTLAEVLRDGPPLEAEGVIGGDPMAVSILEAAVAKNLSPE